jgi:alkylhydroperoxidase/carboxymuconolactone decarboxylase family protein YurZ
MGKIDDALQQPQLDTLRKAYQDKDAVQILSSGIPALDPRTATYIDAIRRTFYEGTAAMQAKDRERCLIAVLAARDAGLNLAIHVYLGLMAHLSPGEIADIIFLGGIYTGVDRISDGLAAEMKTLTVLAQVATRPGSCMVADVMRALHDAFTTPLPPSP